MAIPMSVNELRRFAWLVRDWMKDQVGGKDYRTHVFQEIFAGNLWSGEESVSGAGSGLVATEAVRASLPPVFREYGIRSLLDASCGDFFWMQHIVDSLDEYTGVDIVPELIARNQAAFSSEKVQFLCGDVAVDELPCADAVLCRDSLIHWPTRMIRTALRNFRSTGAKYLLLTQVNAGVDYYDIPVGSFRRINFREAPFWFPAPPVTLLEDDSGSRQLCMWEFDSLPQHWVGPRPSASRRPL